MLIEEDLKEEPKSGDLNTEAIEAVFEEEIIIDEDVTVFVEGGEEPDEIDIAFQANDEGYW